MDINEWLAVKVMGWRVAGTSEPIDQAGLTWYENDYSGEQISKHLWNPRENIAQAFMCAERFDDWSLQKLKSTYIATINDRGFNSQIFDSNPSTAISTAIAKATGFKDD